MKEQNRPDPAIAEAARRNEARDRAHAAAYGSVADMRRLGLPPLGTSQRIAPVLGLPLQFSHTAKERLIDAVESGEHLALLYESDVHAEPGTGKIRVVVPPPTTTRVIFELEDALRRVVPLDICLTVERQAGSPHNRHDRKREERAKREQEPKPLHATPPCHGGPLLGGVSPAVLLPYLAAIARRHREAPLVALVSNVPAGLDANGWRAAVLAMREHDLIDGFTAWMWDDLIAHLRSCADDVTSIRSTKDHALSAYRRAIAPPGPRPKPERRKSPGLPLDMGEW